MKIIIILLCAIFALSLTGCQNICQCQPLLPVNCECSPIDLPNPCECTDTPPCEPPADVPICNCLCTFDPDLPVSSANWPLHLPRHVPGSILLDDPAGPATGLPRTHRHAFYMMYGEFDDLVEDEEMSEWFFEFMDYFRTKRDAGEPLPSHFMHFVQHFDISREAFDEAVELQRERFLYEIERWDRDANSEVFELPNADIIFTFNEDIIRYFYRRE